MSRVGSTVSRCAHTTGSMHSNMKPRTQHMWRRCGDFSHSGPLGVCFGWRLLANPSSAAAATGLLPMESRSACMIISCMLGLPFKRFTTFRLEHLDQPKPGLHSRHVVPQTSYIKPTQPCRHNNNPRRKKDTHKEMRFFVPTCRAQHRNPQHPMAVPRALPKLTCLYVQLYCMSSSAGAHSM